VSAKQKEINILEKLSQATNKDVVFKNSAFQLGLGKKWLLLSISPPGGVQNRGRCHLCFPLPLSSKSLVICTLGVC